MNISLLIKVENVDSNSQNIYEEPKYTSRNSVQCAEHFTITSVFV